MSGPFWIKETNDVKELRESIEKIGASKENFMEWTNDEQKKIIQKMEDLKKDLTDQDKKW